MAPRDLTAFLRALERAVLVAMSPQAGGCSLPPCLSFAACARASEFGEAVPDPLPIPGAVRLLPGVF